MGNTGPCPSCTSNTGSPTSTRGCRTSPAARPREKQHGVTAAHVLQAEDDPQYIVELVFFDTADDANKYRTFMREQVWSSSSPGLTSNPHTVILNEVVETTSKSKA